MQAFSLRFWGVLALGLGLVSAQQRNTALQWKGQQLESAGFNVHEFEVYSGANLISIDVRSKSMQGFDRLDVWLRQGAVPTSSEHHVHATLHSSAGNKVGLHVQNPIQGHWYVAVAPANDPAPLGVEIEHTEHRFLAAAGSAEYELTARTSGCDRGRFGWPKCDQNWMRLSWGAQASFHGALQAGKDIWTCSMYEVAPYTSKLTFDLSEPAKPLHTLGQPQIYARFQAYPTANEYDVTTAVGGTQWSPSVSLNLPKSGTWYVCVHSAGFQHPASIPVSVTVAAQVLPHTECVERNIVAKDGSSVKHVTSCKNEVEKLELRYHSSPKLEDGSHMPLPHFVNPSAPKSGILHLPAGSLRYFSFVLDPSLAGFTLRMILRTTSETGTAIAFLRQNALPETSEYDLRREMKHGHLDWSIRYPKSGQWYVGIYSPETIQFKMHMKVEACPYHCSGKGQCRLRNEGMGLVIGGCSCDYGYSGDGCQKPASDVSSFAYYGSFIFAFISPLVALPPAMIALYGDLFIESFLFLAASTAGLSHQLSSLMAVHIFATSGQSVAGTDAALTEAAVLAALISCTFATQSIAPALMFITTCVSLLFCAWFPTLPMSPLFSLLPAVLAFPFLVGSRMLLRSLATRDKPDSVLDFTGLRISTFMCGIGFSLGAFICQGYETNANYVFVHSLWRVLMYLSAASFLISRFREGFNAQQKDESTSLIAGDMKLV